MFLNRKRGFSPFGQSESGEESELNRTTREYFSKSVDFTGVVKKKSPQADMRPKRAKILEVSLAITLATLVFTVQAARLFSLNVSSAKQLDVKIEVADIPVTEQIRRPPPPPRPNIPIPSEDESIPDDLTIASTEIDLSDIPPPPAPPSEDEDNIFIAYDEPPKIIGGMAELQKHLKYPRVAQNAGIEGIVFVKVLVGTDGQTQRTEVIKSKPENMGFEASATNALEQVKWEPAKQRENKIKVWVSIPVQFRLTS